jgi:fumarate hydratase class I
MSSMIFRRSLQAQQRVSRLATAPVITRIPTVAFSTQDKAFEYQEMFDLAPDTDTPYRKLTGDHVSTFEANGIKFLKVEPEALRLLSAAAMVGA